MARGAPQGPDDGTIAPWATLASLPFAPEVVLPAVNYFSSIKLHEPEPYGYKNSFNRTMPVEGDGPLGWVSRYHFGINMAPMALMIENYLSGLGWALAREEYLYGGGVEAGGVWGRVVGVKCALELGQKSSPVKGISRWEGAAG